MRCRVCSISSTLLGPQSLFAQHRVLLSFKVYWFPSMTTARALVSSTIICPWKTEMVSCFSLYSICRSHYSQSDLLKTENVFSGFPRLLNLMGNWVIIDPHSVPFAGAPLSLEDYAYLPLLLFVSWGRNPEESLTKVGRPLLTLGTVEVLTLRSCHQASCNLSAVVQISSWCQWRFLLWQRRFFVSTFLSNLRAGNWPYNLNSLMDLTRVTAFQFV